MFAMAIFLVECVGLVQIKYILIQPEGNCLSGNNEAAAGT